MAVMFDIPGMLDDDNDKSLQTEYDATADADGYTDIPQRQEVHSG